MKSETIKNQIIVTSGKKYLDIDAYGAIFAYRTLLRSLGYEAYAMSTAKINESVPLVIRKLGFAFDSVSIDDDAEFIILDVSNPKFFDTFVGESSIKEIIDHHTGFEDYWNECGVPTI